MEVSKRFYINTFIISIIFLAALIFFKKSMVTGFIVLNDTAVLFTAYDWFIIIFTWMVIVSGFGIFIKGRYDKKKRKNIKEK